LCKVGVALAELAGSEAERARRRETVAVDAGGASELTL
jgi:hypothetical protein